jgi:hypothetical protein
MSRSFKIIVGILFYPYGLYLIYQHFKNGKNEKVDSSIKEETFREKILTLYNEIEALEVTDTSIFIEDIKKNEKTIIAFGDDKLLKDFLKLSSFIINIESEIESTFITLPKLTDKVTFLDDRDKLVLKVLGGQKDFESSSIGDFYRQLRKKKLVLISMINYHLNFYQTSQILLNLLLEGNKTDFYMIYEQFDKIGVFRSGFENELLGKLDNINTKLDNLSNQLFKLNQSIKYQNLLLSINTIQLRSINKKLKK